MQRVGNYPGCRVEDVVCIDSKSRQKQPPRNIFFNQVNSLYTTNMPPQGDFFVDNHFLFEVGRKGKSFDQIKDVPNSFLAIDDVKYGHKNRIPLWMFGLLY